MGVNRFLRRMERDFRLGPPTLPPRPLPEVAVPGQRAQLARGRRLVAYGLAVVLPAGAALVMLPLRADHSQIVALILVVPVVVVAILGATGPAVVAALAAAGAYAVAHTEPYWRFVIDDPDDVVTTVTLVAVAVAVGTLCASAVHMRARDAARLQELQQLVALSRSVTEGADVDALAERVCQGLTAMLGLRACRWQPGYHGGTGPVLLPSGEIVDRGWSLGPDLARLPDNLEIPAVTPTGELGRFVLTPDAVTVVSAEERLTAATIVGLFAHAARPGDVADGGGPDALR